MDYETMRRLRESDPGKFTGIGREKGAWERKPRGG